MTTRNTEFASRQTHCTQLNSHRWLVALLFAMLGVLNSPLVLAHTDLEAYHQHLSSQAKQRNIPGFSWVRVSKQGGAEFGHYGVTHKRGQAINKETRFRLASVSKTFSGLLFAKLVNNNQLAWQTPLAALAPGFGFEQRPDLQLQHLLGQSSGYTPNAYDNLIDANYRVPQVLSMLAKLSPLCAPGKCYTYQNTLYAMLDQYFVQQNTSYANVLTKQLLTPLAMHRTNLGRHQLMQDENWARPHVAINQRRYAKVQVTDNYYQYPAAAGVNSSTGDLARYLHALLGGKEKVLPAQVLTAIAQPSVESKRELQRRQWQKYLKGAHYGRGWRVYDFAGHRMLYHGGWVRGYRADIAFVPEKGVGFALLLNAEDNHINRFSADFWRQQLLAQP